MNVHITPRINATDAGEPNPKGTTAGPLKVDVELVQIPVTVTDDRNRVVIGLQRNNFSIYDRTEPQLIRHFSTDDAPISLGIIFDVSSSMYGKLDKSSQAIIQFLRNANPQDEFFLITFNDRPELRMDFTTSVEEIQNEISKVKPDGTTALLDAVYLGLDRMKDAHNKRKALLIVSDGGDNTVDTARRNSGLFLWRRKSRSTRWAFSMTLQEPKPNATARIYLAPSLL
jgi:Ca-activated chloride channel homolog